MSNDAYQLERILDDLRNADPAGRRQAAFRLGAMANPVIVPDLIAAAGDADDTVRAFVASGLASLGRAALNHVRTSLADGNNRVRETMVAALRHMNDAAVVPDLIPLLNDPADTVRGAAANALREYGTPEATAALHRWQPGQQLPKGQNHDTI